MLREMLTGTRTLADAPPIPPILRSIVDRCTAPNRDDRWQSARDLKAALELAHRSPPPHHPRSAPPPRALHPHPETRAPLGVAAATTAASSRLCLR